MKRFTTLTAGMLIMICTTISSYAAGRPLRLYVGQYNDQGGAGFQAVNVDLKRGLFTPVFSADAGANPSYFCRSTRWKLIYAINEVDEFAGEKAGGITTLAINAATGTLTRVHELAVPNGGPCYIALSPREDFLLVANYGGGSIAVVRLDERGLPAAVTDTVLFSGTGGAVSRAHMIAPGPHGQIYVTDLGLDRITVYELDGAAGRLREVPESAVTLAKGSGPRHFTFSRDGAVMYVINERSSTLTVLAVAADGRLREIQTLSTLPPGWTEVNYCADIHLGKSGKFLYGTNRGHNSIVTFRVGRDGQLTLAGHTPCGGNWPRNFVIDPAGKYLLAGNQRSGNITLFRLNPKSGLPEATPHEFKAAAPACLKFAE